MKRWEFAVLIAVIIILAGGGMWLANRGKPERAANDLFACQRAVVMLRPGAERVPMVPQRLNDKGQSVIRLAWTIDGVAEFGFCRFERNSPIPWMEEILISAPGAPQAKAILLQSGDRLNWLNSKVQLAMAERAR